MTLDVLQAVAKALKVPAWALLHPDFDAKNPLVIQTAAQIEAEVERRVKERIKPLSAIIGGLIDPEEARPDGRRLQRESRPTKTRRKVKPRAKVGAGKKPPKGGTQ